MVENAMALDRKKSEVKRPIETLDAEVPSPKALVGKRHIVTFLIFLGMANAYIMRTNMSVAIVAMVNHTANLDDTEEIKTINECGEIITNETEAAQR
ncbi:hypothetical protein HN011_008137, partial [Eciton burchellii]